MTATTTRMLADAFYDRLHAADRTDRLDAAIQDAVGMMAPYMDETGDLRPSEQAWIDTLRTEAADAARAAALAAIVTVFERELPRLLPSRDDPAVPWPHVGEPDAEFERRRKTAVMQRQRVASKGLDTTRKQAAS